MKPVKLNKNIAILQQFVVADKPTWMKPIHTAIIEVLLKNTDSKKFDTYIAVQTIADELHVGYSTVARALQEMLIITGKWNPHGLVTKHSGKSQFHSNTWAVQISALHLERQFARTIISVDAYNIAQRYLTILRALPKYESRKTAGRMCSSYRSHPSHIQRWELLSQDWLDDGFTREQIDVLVDVAFRLWPDTARHGMHTLRQKFTSLCRETGVVAGEPMPTTQIDLPMQVQR